MTYKLLNTDSSCQNLFQFDESCRTRGHSKKLSQKRGDTRVPNHYFSNRVITHWNNPPDTAVIAPSIDVFKIAVNKSWSFKPWKTEWSAILFSYTVYIYMICQKSRKTK